MLIKQNEKTMALIYNKLSKKPDSKTGFLVTVGEPLFGSQTVYVLEPKYVHGRSPVFSLVSAKGRHISGLYQACNGFLIGDFENKGLVVFPKSEGLAFEVFLSDLPRLELKAKLCSGQLNDDLLKARNAA